MNESRAVYCVVQYLPDPSRAEAANVGVVLFVPSTRQLEIRTSTSLARVSRFFSPTPNELKRVKSGVAALRHRLGLVSRDFADEKGLEHFAAVCADPVRITAPRVMVVGDPVADLKDLYEELVGDATARSRAKRGNGELPHQLAEVFDRLAAQNKAWNPKQITVPTVGTKFNVTAAYQNGVTNYVRAEPVSENRMRSLERLGFAGRLIHENGVDGKKARLVVVSSDAKADAKAESLFEKSLRDCDVDFIRNAEVDEFAKKVEQTAH